MMQQFGSFFINHWILFLALALTLIALAVLEFSNRLLGFREVQPQQLTKMLNHDNAVVLDVREEPEFREGHIINAVHTPLSTLETKFKSLDKFKGRPIIVTCQAGDRSARAASLLQKNGFEQVHKLAGGLISWRDAKYPLTSK